MVVAFNRDMDVGRESKQLDFHPNFKNIICGLDILTGTTWLAINIKTGHFAMLTNYRTPNNKVEKKYESRGNLILEYVKISDASIPADKKQYQTIDEYIAKAFASDKHYKAFNIVYGNSLEGAFSYWHSPNHPISG